MSAPLPTDRAARLAELVSLLGGSLSFADRKHLSEDTPADPAFIQQRVEEMRRRRLWQTVLTALAAALGFGMVWWANDGQLDLSTWLIVLGAVTAPITFCRRGSRRIALYQSLAAPPATA